MSITGSPKPAATSMSPRSCMSRKRFAVSPAPTLAPLARSSFRVSGPSVAKQSRPPTSSTRCSSRNAGSGSSSQCSIRLDQTRPRLLAASGMARTSAFSRRGPRLSRRCSRGVAARTAAAWAAHSRWPTAGPWRVARLQFADAVAGGAADVGDARRVQFDEVETLGHASAHFAGEHRRRIVGRGGVSEFAAHVRFRRRAAPGA
jgi:hypothetical protein